MYNRREFIRKSVVASATAAFISVPEILWAAEKDIHLTILHTNDMHSRIDPFPNDGRMFGGKGGMAARAAVIKDIREKERNVLLFDAGDIFQGTPYYNFFGGELELKLMSEMGYDASTIGNHDFDGGLAGLKRQLPNAKFDFLCANYDFSDTILKNQFLPYKIFKRDGIRVGVFGLGIGLRGLVTDKNFEATRYSDPIAVAREMVQELKNKNCHLIVCLSHLGYAYKDDKISDRVLASKVSGIDLIIGGHTHTFLDEPEVVENPEGAETLINQVGWAGINLGRIDFTFTKGEEKKHKRSEVLPIEEKSR